LPLYCRAEPARRVANYLCSARSHGARAGRSEDGVGVVGQRRGRWMTAAGRVGVWRVPRLRVRAGQCQRRRKSGPAWALEQVDEEVRAVRGGAVPLEGPMRVWVWCAVAPAGDRGSRALQGACGWVAAKGAGVGRGAGRACGDREADRGACGSLAPRGLTSAVAQVTRHWAWSARTPLLVSTLMTTGGRSTRPAPVSLHSATPSGSSELQSRPSYLHSTVRWSVG